MNELIPRELLAEKTFALPLLQVKNCAKSMVLYSRQSGRCGDHVDDDHIPCWDLVVSDFRGFSVFDVLH